MNIPARADSGSGLRCRICRGTLAPRWRLPVLSGRFEALYEECRECHALQIAAPTWLAEAYADEASSRSSLLDPGRFRRNLSTFIYLQALERSGAVKQRARVLDFGGGSGLLTQMFMDAGYDAWQTDEYVKDPLFAATRVHREFREIPARTFDLVTALEVFEHLHEPVDIARRLERALKPDGALVISTEIYRSGVHDERWPYLAPDGGQHITFWSREALTLLAVELGFASVGCFPGDAGFLLIFSHEAEARLHAQLSDAHRILADPLHMQDVFGRLDFRHDGIVNRSYGVLPRGG